ncbi:hypothetical protein [Metapseudomonas otitidis]|uniref:hypothetical protein n=1 Tax=Metapseudomonas otitidis TaxID=319939 RepID=UPI001CA3B8FF|nr:hypothetical protein [Pseudomonas otitidis]QZX85336.1 hypothetical protein K6751_11750 [Pseudomonas otitidis]
MSTIFEGEANISLCAWYPGRELIEQQTGSVRVLVCRHSSGLIDVRYYGALSTLHGANIVKVEMASGLTIEGRLEQFAINATGGWFSLIVERFS